MVFRISERFDETFGYMWYQINSFYVEVQYNCADNVIEKLLSFSITNKLDAYINEIDISEIME